MSTVRHALLAAGLALLPSPGAAAQEAERLCGTCGTTGVVDVELSPRELIEHEHGPTWKVEACSEGIELDNLGLDWMPCPRCKAPAKRAEAQARWDAIAKTRHEWLAERRRMDKHVRSKGLVHLETTHFVLAWDLAKHVASDKKPYKAHEGAHLYARRMEELYAHYQELLGVVDADNMRNKHHIYLFENLGDAMAVGPVYAQMSSQTTARRAGGQDHESTLVMFRDKDTNPKDEDLQRHWIHSVVHQFTSVHFNPHWFLDGTKPLSPPWLADKYGWMDEGLAHWFEMEFDGQAVTYCTQEQDTTSRWKGGDWRKNVFKAVQSGDVPSFTETITVPTQALSPAAHQFAWSWIDYLMAQDPKAMGRAIKLAKHERPVRDLLMECWKIPMLGFQERWAEWVKVEYDPNRKGAKDRGDEGAGEEDGGVGRD